MALTILLLIQVVTLKFIINLYHGSLLSSAILLYDFFMLQISANKQPILTFPIRLAHSIELVIRQLLIQVTYMFLILFPTI